MLLHNKFWRILCVLCHCFDKRINTKVSKQYLWSIPTGIRDTLRASFEQWHSDYFAAASFETKSNSLSREDCAAIFVNLLVLFLIHKSNRLLAVIDKYFGLWNSTECWHGLWYRVLWNNLHIIAYHKTVNLIFWLYAFHGFHSFIPSHLHGSYPVGQNQASTTSLLTKGGASTSCIPVLCVSNILLYQQYHAQYPST